MPCSDSVAQMLEDSDPLFRQRNAQWRDVDNYLCTASASLCACGERMFQGERFALEMLEPPSVNWGNHYIIADEDLRDIVPSTKTRKQMIEECNAAFSGGDDFYRWLVEHWGYELKRLEIDNERNARELPTKYGEKAEKRRSALSRDIPKASIRRQQVEWAKGMIGK